MTKSEYFANLVYWCSVLSAIQVDEDLFNKLAPVELRTEKDNMRIRYFIEDRIRELLRKEGDFPPAGQGRDNES